MLFSVIHFIWLSGRPLLIKSYFPAKNHEGSLRIVLSFTCLVIQAPAELGIFLKAESILMRYGISKTGKL